MKTITLFSNKRDYKQAAVEIIEQARMRVDFKPDLALFYATLKYNGKYQSMLDILHEEYGDIPQIGATVDGMIYPDDLRADGAALVLCKDTDARIHVDGVKEKGAVESAEKLAKKVKCEKGVIILHFPLVHVPGALKSSEFYAKGMYYSKQCGGKNQEKQKEYARKFADYCNRENIFYLPPTILSIFARHTDYKIPVIGMNAMHTQVRFNSPHIFCNFEDIEDGIAALTIEKEGINVTYNDIFPDKGKTMEETKDIVRREFTIVKEFKANFEKNILISLDGVPPISAVKDLTAVLAEKEEDLFKKLDKGNFQVQTPYMLIFFTKKSKGMVLVGMGSYYPFDLYPFFIDTSEFIEDVFLGYEYIYFKSSDFISSMRHLRCNNDFKFFCIDVGSVSAFGKRVFTYKDEIKELVDENYFGIMTEAPSVYLPKGMKKRNYISEAQPDIFFNSAGTNICLEI